MSTFGYVGQNPILRFDPKGLDWTSDGAEYGGALGCAVGGGMGSTAGAAGGGIAGLSCGPGAVACSPVGAAGGWVAGGAAGCAGGGAIGAGIGAGLGWCATKLDDWLNPKPKPVTCNKEQPCTPKPGPPDGEPCDLLFAGCMGKGHGQIVCWTLYIGCLLGSQ
jgi:hypothetical protein